MNRLKTYVLLAALTALFVGAGYLVGGPAGMAVALVLAAGMNLFSYWNADKLVLGMYGAQPVDQTHPDPAVRDFVRDVASLAEGASLPRPRTYLTPSSRTPSPPGATRSMRRWPRPPA